MNWPWWLGVLALGLAAIPCGLFLANLTAYRRPSPTPPHSEEEGISILIPARNESSNIEEAIRSLQGQPHRLMEILILDDHSEDDTAQRVRRLAREDSRIRCLSGEPLPTGWCGKQFACHQLARSARYPWLLFMDADVRLEAGALHGMIHFMKASGASLASGVPRQELRTVPEKLLLPLIHFLLLGFLPMRRMRRSRSPRYAAGCGQLFVARADDYQKVGGHASIRGSRHDGLTLPRAFRRQGRHTDLFDATGLARCRMYRHAREVAPGLAKNATEGLAAPGVLLPMTLLLGGGQILPFLLMLWPRMWASEAWPLTVAAAGCSLLPRGLAVWRFAQPPVSALLHPLGVAWLLGIQWWARLRQALGKETAWKGRGLPEGRLASRARSLPRRAWKLGRSAGWLVLGTWGAMMAVSWGADPGSSPDKPVKITAPLTLETPSGERVELSFPRPRPVLLMVADRKGFEEVKGWVDVLKPRCKDRVDLLGVADVSAVPPPLRPWIRSRFRKEMTYPVWMDWKGAVSAAFPIQDGEVNLLVFSKEGELLTALTGSDREAGLALLDRILKPRSGAQAKDTPPLGPPTSPTVRSVRELP